MGTHLLTDEHEALRQGIRLFVKGEMEPYLDEWEQAGSGLPDQVFRRMGELGYYGLKYPEEYGGSGIDYLADAVLQEEMGRCGSGGAAAVVGAHTGIAMPPVYNFGNEEQRRRLLVPAIRGEKIAALGITEPNAGSDVAGISTTAARRGDAYLVNGSKIFITNGVNCDFVVLAVRTGRGTKRYHGLSLLVVERGTTGFKVGRKLEKLGWRASDTAELVFDDCLVPATNLLGEQDQGFYYIMKNFQWERLMLAMQFGGLAQLALEKAVTYARQRVQFGHAIAEFQVLQHRLAEMAAEVEAARELSYHSVGLYAAGEECVSECSMAKLMATETCMRVTYEAIQIHGGYGFTKEFPVERYWRDARLGTIGGGTSEVMRNIIAKKIGL